MHRVLNFACIAEPPTVQLHTEQSDDQVPTLLDGKLQLQLAKEKKPTIEPTDSESEVQVDTQLCTSKSLCRQHNIVLLNWMLITIFRLNDH